MLLLFFIFRKKTTSKCSSRQIIESFDKLHQKIFFFFLLLSFNFWVSLLENYGLVRWPRVVVLVTRHETVVHFDAARMKPIPKTAKRPKHVKFNRRLDSAFKDSPSTFLTAQIYCCTRIFLENELKFGFFLIKKFQIYTIHVYKK